MVISSPKEATDLTDKRVRLNDVVENGPWRNQVAVVTSCHSSEYYCAFDLYIEATGDRLLHINPTWFELEPSAAATTLYVDF